MATSSPSTPSTPRPPRPVAPWAEQTPVTPFWVLVFALSLPFWLLDPALGGVATVLPMDMPAGALMAVTPLVAAVALRVHSEGWPAARHLLAQTLDPRTVSPRRWYVPAVLIMPLVLVSTYALMWHRGDRGPRSDPGLGRLALLALVFLLAAAAEEAGWTSFATDLLRQRFGAASTALLIGVVWAVWHVVPYRQGGHDLRWITAQCVVTVAARVLIVWLYCNCGGVPAAIAFHMMINWSTSLLPDDGTWYDPVAAAVVMTPPALGVLLVLDHATLTRRRRLRRHP